MKPGDTGFAGSIPQMYDRYLVPLIFAPYATDIAARVSAVRHARVLEIAAGTGAVTRELARALPATTHIVATDLNQSMLDQAAAAGTSRPVEFRAADAMKLPFDDASFDAVVCQFGVMFFPDRPAAMREARRVMRPGGALVFNAWDRIEANEFALAVTDALAAVFPDDPPRFMARTPHGYHDKAVIAGDVAKAGFASCADRHRRSAKPRRFRAHRRDRVLPGHAAAQRDRIARRLSCRCRHRRGRARDRSPLRRRRRGWRHPGARRRGAALDATARSRTALRC